MCERTWPVGIVSFGGGYEFGGLEALLEPRGQTLIYYETTTIVRFPDSTLILLLDS